MNAFRTWPHPGHLVNFIPTRYRSLRIAVIRLSHPATLVVHFVILDDQGGRVGEADDGDPQAPVSGWDEVDQMPRMWPSPEGVHRQEGRREQGAVISKLPIEV